MAKPFEKTRITEKTFSANLKIVQGNNRQTRGIIQGLAICAFEMYKAHGQTGKLTQLYKACQLIGSHGQFKTFVESSSNIKLADEGKKNAKFVKANKQPADYEITDWWYQFEKAENPNANAPKDLAKMIATFERTITKAAADKKLVEGQDSIVPELVAYLEMFDLKRDEHTAPELQAIKKAA